MELSYRLFSPSHAHADDRPKLAEAWKCWRQTWGEMIRELEGGELPSSDDFLRQHEIGALFYGDDCVGLSGFRWVDLRLPSVRDDSYFRSWPSELLDEIAETTPRVCIGSNLAVAPGWRGPVGSTNLRASEILLTLAVLRYRWSDADIMLGTMRNDRGMNRNSYRLGARPVFREAICHGVPVDLVVFDRISTAHVLPPVQLAIPSLRERITERTESVAA